MGLREQRERVTIDGLGNVGAGRYTIRSKVAESGELIKSITPITHSAIEGIPKAMIVGYTEEQCKYIMEQHKQLLALARDANDGKEVAFIFSGDFAEKSINFGENDIIEFKSKESVSMLNSRRNLFIMHNHPRNSSFSTNDIQTMLKTDNIKSMSIIKNNGGIEVWYCVQSISAVLRKTLNTEPLKNTIAQCQNLLPGQKRRGC
ncbi:MAG: hypothetical protein IJ428_03750 [Clostridia bacterium]|nr:hypothetical protein [Clostridia bacterium]